MFHSSSSSLPTPIFSGRHPASYRRVPATRRLRLTSPTLPLAAIRHDETSPSLSELSTSSTLSTSSAVPPPVPATHLARNLGHRPNPELGLLSLLFAVSMALGSFIAMAIVSLPTLNALRELGVSVDKLSKVVSEEVPGTLSSLKLSGFEIHELTQHLSKIRKIISGNQFGKDGEPKKSRSKGGRKNPDV